ncbi:DNA-binding LytR/AlgR family response regulator [Arcicella rosea]|uniref:LytR/AlgR family response regulator transcription factor n=1 Tax=Arcicella rosea TaxID=502909 RepID=UPI00345D53A3
MITCLIVDDEPFSVEALKNYALRIPFLEVVLATTSAVEAAILIQKQNIDLVFSDIHMPELSGLELVKLIQGKSKVIFATAYSDYALEGYQHDVIDYLMKPISFEKFLKAAQKAEKLIELEKSQVIKAPEKSINTNNEDFIFVKTEHKGKYIKIKFEDILMIEGSGNYVTIYTIQQEKIVVLLTFKYLEDHLPKTQFIRTHKSYIVALQAISGLDGNTVILGDLSVPIGVTYRENILNHFSGKMI